IKNMLARFRTIGCVSSYRSGSFRFFIFNSNGDTYRKTTALALLAFHKNIPVMHLHELTAYRQANTAPLVQQTLRQVVLEEPFEYLLLFFFGNTNTGIHYFYFEQLL